MKRRQVYTYQLLFVGCSALMLGLISARVVGAIPMVAAVGLVSLPLLVGRRMLSVLPVALIFFALGQVKGGQISYELDSINGFVGHSVVLKGQVSNDPIYHSSGQFEFRVRSVTLDGDKVPGIFRIRAFTNGVNRGDKISAEGKLYDGFGPIKGTISYAKLEVIQAASSPFERFRQRFIAAFRSNVGDPESPLGLGFLLGTRSILPESLTVALSATGLTHIVAVSGYNLTILVSLTRRLFARYSRFMSMLAAMGLLFAFIVLAGDSPSIYRASVVSVISLVSWFWGRSARPLLVLWLSAAITAYMEPLYIWGDIGWYLSFCAFFGVLVLAPLVAKKIYKNRRTGLLGGLVIETSMAQLVTLPLVMVIFGDVSFVSLIANAVVLPLIPIAMLLSFMSGLSAMLLPQIAGWLALPAYYLLSFIVQVISLLAQVPGALQSIKLDWIGFVVVWLAIVGLWLGLSKYTRKNNSQDYQSTDQDGIISTI